MGRVFSANGLNLPKYKELRGQVLHVQGIASIAWLVLDQPLVRPAMQLTLMSIPNGTRSRETLGTIVKWVANGSLWVGSFTSDHQAELLTAKIESECNADQRVQRASGTDTTGQSDPLPESEPSICGI